MYIKVRDNHKIRSKGLMIAIGVTEQGQRKIIGFHISETESKTSWSEFFEALGLKSPDLICF